MCIVQETEYYGYFPGIGQLLEYVFEQTNKENEEQAN